MNAPRADDLDFSRSRLHWALTTLSYLEGTTLALVGRRGSPPREACNFLNCPDDYAAFCHYISRSEQAQPQTIKELRKSTPISLWMNQSPFHVLLGDHWSWEWFETCMIAKIIEGRKEFSVTYFDPLIIRYKKVWTSSANHLIQCEVGLVSEPYDLREQIAPRVAEFNSLIRACWPSMAPSGNREDGPRYSIEWFVQALGERRPELIKGSEIDETPYRLAFDLFENRNLDLAFPKVAEICTAISAYSHAASNKRPKGNKHLERYLNALLRRGRDGTNNENLKENANNLFRSLFRTRSRLGQLAWNSYFIESRTALERYLQQHSFLSIAPAAFDDDTRRTKFWDKICRLLCRLFLSTEVTLYRLKTDQSPSPLSLIGSHCTGRGGREKSEYKAKFMHNAGIEETSREISISYRAADENSPQYVRDRTAPGTSARILIPETKEWPWGLSGLAVPIRINGSVWGVIEFIADGPNHYGNLIRAQCEVIASFLSTSLMTANLFEALENVEGYWTERQEDGDSRRTALCRTLATIFNAAALSIYTATKDEDGHHFRVLAFGTWPARTADSAVRSHVRDYSPEVLRFLDSGEKVRDITLREKGSDAVGSSFLVRLQPRSARSWAGAIIVTISGPIIRDPGWEDNMFALGQVIASAVANVTSSASWGREARRELRHEYHRINASLRGIEVFVKERLLTKLSEGDRKLGEIPLADLGTAIDSIRAMSDVLLSDVYDPMLQESSRIRALQKSKEEYLAGPRLAVSPSEIFLSQFNTASRAHPEKQVRVPPPSSHGRFVMMDRVALTQILGTLADNAVKYSTPGGEVRMEYAVGSSGALRLTISNLGPPMTDDEVENAFEDGFRGASARSLYPNEGSGLGLGFAKKAIELWNGLLDYSVRPTQAPLLGEGNHPAFWHRLTLTFPKAIVVPE